MRAIVIGSAAGGGFPQWNCACANCTEVRGGGAGARARTQDSVAVTADGVRWVLLNASPDVHAQIRSNPVLAPQRGRLSPIAAVVLTNGDLDHVLGLLSLRESHRFAVYATRAVIDGLVAHNVFFRTLARFEGQVRWRRLELDRDTALESGDSSPLGLTVRALAVTGKLPVHLEGIATASPEDNVALRIKDPGRGQTIVYASSVGALGALAAQAEGADAALVDGTFWSDDELARAGVGTATAASMAHLPVGGNDGSLALLGTLRAGRRIYTHVNNTNPMLLQSSPERRAVEAAGWEIAHDGMEVVS